MTEQSMSPNISTASPLPDTPETMVYDYIVIGSGAGGGPLAARLALNGQRVLVIEAGVDTADNNRLHPPETYDVPAFNAAATEDARTGWDFSVRHYSGDSQQAKDSKYNPAKDPSTTGGVGKGGIFYPRAAALGGCTSHHAMIIIRPNDSDWDDIANMTGDQSWRSENMQGYFPKIEKCLYYSVYRGFFGKFLGLVQRVATFINPSLHLDPNGHGRKGWQPTSFIDPLVIVAIARADRVLLRLLFDVVWSALSGRTAASAFKRAASHLQIIQFLDPNVRAKYVTGRAHLSLISIGTDGSRRTGLREWLKTVAGDPNNTLTLKTNAHATRLIFEKDEASHAPRAVGVEVELGSYLYSASKREAVPTGGTAQYFASKEVIVSGGSFNTPQLLMLSGIGDAAQLQKTGISGPCDKNGRTIAAIVNLPGVGRNLQDRYEVSVISEMKSEFSSLKGATFQPDPSNDPDNTHDPLLKQWRTNQSGLYATNGGTLAFMMSSSSNQRKEDPDLFIFGIPAAFRGYYWGWSRELLWRTKGAGLDQRNLWTWVILKAYTDNNKGLVQLRSRNPFDVPDIDFNSFSNGPKDRDTDALVEAVKRIREINAKISGMRKVEVQPGNELLKDAELAQWVRQEAWGHHACGTCRMGSDNWRNDVGLLEDRNAVLDSQFRVHGVQNLRVVDASVFPRIPGYFIVTPVFMISEKAADVILADRSAYPDSLLLGEAAAIAIRRAAIKTENMPLTESDAEANEETRWALPVLENEPPNKGPTPKPCLPDDSIGLALSGGGISSATYCLGVLQAFARNELLPRIDFLSTVSSGGLIGGFLGRLYTRQAPGTPNLHKQVAEVLTNPNSPEIWWLRRHADYINGAGRTDLETDFAITMRNFAATLFCVSALLMAVMGGLRWAADWLFIVDTGWTVYGFTMSPWWYMPVLIATFSVAPLVIGYWLTANPGSQWRYSIHGFLAWMVMLGSAISGLSIPLIRDYAFLAVSVLLLAWLWQEVLRWRTPPAAPGAELVLLYRNRLARTLGTALLLFSATVVFAILDTLARLIADVSTIPYIKCMTGAALLAPLILLYLRGRAIKVRPLGVSAVATRLGMPLSDRIIVDRLSFALATFLFVAVDTLAHVAFNNEQIGVWTTLVALVVSLAIGQSMNFVNLSSPQESLTQKLTRTFLGASNHSRVHPVGTNAPVPVQIPDDGDDAFLSEYHPEAHGGPLHLISVCVNQTVDHLSSRQLHRNKVHAMAVGPCGMSVGWQYHARWEKPDTNPSDEVKNPSNRINVQALPIAPDPNAFHVFARRDDKAATVENLTVGCWMAISAGSILTYSGRNTGLSMSLLRGLLNVRFGYWWNSGIGAGDRPGRYPLGAWRKIKSLPSRIFPGQSMLLNEWRAYFHGPSAKHWYLSDGGQFDNTGIYELVRRRLPLIIAVDATRDENYKFDDIANMMRQVRLDFGAEIQWLAPKIGIPSTGPWHSLDVAAATLQDPIAIPSSIRDLVKQPQSIGGLYDLTRDGTTSAALARVYFRDDPAKSSWLLVIKANLAPKVPADVTSYAVANESFPNQSIVAQSFEDGQWESYRSLGEAAGKAIFR